MRAGDVSPWFQVYDNIYPYGTVTVYNAQYTVLGSSAYAMQYLYQGG
jgi:hypothetical protein